ncbi:hypothetical protein D3C71_752990 [compost metagenome]
MVERIRGHLYFLGCGLEHVGGRTAASGGGIDSFGERAGVADDLDDAACTGAGAGQFERLDQPNGPGCQRSDGKPDHDAFNNPVRRHEHAPGRKVVRDCQYRRFFFRRHKVGYRFLRRSLGLCGRGACLRA